MTEPLIKIENLNFWYQKDQPTQVWALRNINAEINPGDYVAFFGPSGCGKTSLLYLVSGIEGSQEGRILVRGRDISQFSRQELALYRQIGVGMIFQQFNLIDSLTVAANIELPMSFLGISRGRRHVEAMKLLDRLNIKNLADRLPHELSGGQQQRVGIARALANNPPLIIADEPLGNLDSENSKNVLEFLKELNENDKRTIIMVTHEAWSLRDVKKIFYMKDGAITKIDSNQPGTLADSISEHLSSQLNGVDLNLKRSKNLASLLFRGFSTMESERFEELTHKRLANKISGGNFLRHLEMPFSEGGLGLWKKKAAKVANYVNSVVDEEPEMRKTLMMLKHDPEITLDDQVRQFRNWLIDGKESEFNLMQKTQIEQLIKARLRNKVGAEEFKKIIYTPRYKHGLGLSMNEAQFFTDKFETLLSESAYGA